MTVDFPDNVLTGYYFSDPPEILQKMLRITDSEPVWEILNRLEPALDTLFSGSCNASEFPRQFDYWERPALDGGIERVLTVREGFVVPKDLCFPEKKIYLSKGVILEPTAILKSPVFIGPDTEVRQGAYIRGNVIIGAHCTVGHNTEVKTSIFFHHTEAGHFAYIGDSVLGSFVNIGAGTKLANLPFRTLVQKQEIRFPKLKLQISGIPCDIGRSKIGAVLGDGVETGCNSTISPGTFIGPDSWVYPCLDVPRDFYPARTILKHGARLKQIPKRPD